MMDECCSYKTTPEFTNKHKISEPGIKNLQIKQPDTNHNEEV